MLINKYNIHYDKAIKNWYEALPIGNGKLGALIYGNKKLNIALDRVDLWDNRPNPTTLSSEFNYKTLVELSKSKIPIDWKKREELFENIFMEYPYPSKITGGRLELDFGLNTDNIVSNLDIEKAIADVDIDSGKYTIQSFMTANDFIGVARIEGDFSIDIHIPDYISGNKDGYCKNLSGIGSEDMDLCLKYPRTKIVRDGDFLYYNQKTFTEFQYGIVVLIKKFEKHSELYFTIATNEDNVDFINYAKDKLVSASERGYDELKVENEAWWYNYWEKSDINIGDFLLEKTYYRSWYLFGSCSRKGGYPMPLQGVWTADNDSLPPWKGDYHHDTNTELSYQAFLKANRLYEGEVFVDYLWKMKDKFRSFAKSFFNVDGILLPSCSTLDGKPMGGWAQYSLSPTMTIWAAQSFDEYWLYTGNMEFLKNRAYPFFVEVESAISGLLILQGTRYYLPLSTSPEIYDATQKAYLKPNTNFDLALLRYLYTTLIKYTQILGLPSERYYYMLRHLSPIFTDRNNHIKLNKIEHLSVSHRHFSHLMCLYPLHLINYDKESDKLIYEATLDDIERLGTGNWVGFSFAMCAQIYAMALNGNAAYEKLCQFSKGFVAENGFHLNGDFKNYGYTTFHYHPFTLEALFGFCDALQEMLMQCHQGYIHLFPAIPEEWKTQKISFRNFRSYGGVLLDASTINGKTIEVTLKVREPKKIKIMNNFGSNNLFVEHNGMIENLNVIDKYIRLECSRGVYKIYR